MKPSILIRPYKPGDYPFIKQLNQLEGWNNLVEKEEDTKKRGIIPILRMLQQSMK